MEKRGTNIGALLREHRTLVLIVLIALAIRLVFFAAVRPWADEILQRAILVLDATGYHRLAVGILESRSFDTFGAFRTPGYPVFVAGVYSLFGPRRGRCC